MHIAHINRYPVKGFTPERLERTRLQEGGGIPFDRACAFRSGNLPDVPVAGGWVPARTFLQLTVYPELAKFTARFDETLQSITLTAPDGRVAKASLADGGDCAEANTLIQSHFEAGPHAIPELHVQTPGRGHWDFTDTGISLINLASVEAIATAAGATIDPLRFRGNIYLGGLPAWAEFSMIGQRYRMGGAEFEITRPAMRCAATTVDPETASTDINVPVHLRRLTGHLFCGVYGRVTRAGDIGTGDALETIGAWSGNPYENLPPRAPELNQWPRFLHARTSGDRLELRNLAENWPLLPAEAGDRLRVHPVKPGQPKSALVSIVGGEAAESYWVIPFDGISDGDHVLVSGPYPA